MLQPWPSAFLDLHRQIDEMFQELIFRPWAISGPTTWQPALDYHETAVDYVVELDLPGVLPEEVHILVSKHGLTIAGQRQLAPPVGAVCNRCERKGGLFQRSLEVPHPIDPDKVRAEYQLGILRIVMPKKISVEESSGTGTSTVIQVTVR